MITDRVLRAVEAEFGEADRQRAGELIARIGDELTFWREATEGDRIELAAVDFARGDLTRLTRAIEIALRDWRDLLQGYRG